MCAENYEVSKQFSEITSSFVNTTSPLAHIRFINTSEHRTNACAIHKSTQFSMFKAVVSCKLLLAVVLLITAQKRVIVCTYNQEKVLKPQHIHLEPLHLRSTFQCIVLNRIHCAPRIYRHYVYYTYIQCVYIHCSSAACTCCYYYCYLHTSTSLLPRTMPINTMHDSVF
jgi:hypothetical protein